MFYDGKKTVVFDTETQGLNLLSSNKLWDLGWLVIEGNKILEQHRHFIRWPNFKLSPQIAAMLHFNRAEYEEKAEDPKKILDLFSQYLYSQEYVISGFNALNFDVYIISQWQRELDQKVDYSYIPRVRDVHAFVKSIQYDIPFNKKTDNILSFQYKMINTARKGVKTGIDAMTKLYDIPVNEEKRHTSLFDCFLTKNIWDKIKYKMDL